MTKSVKTLSSELTVTQALEKIQDLDYVIYPVLDRNGFCTGMITEIKLRRTLARNEGEQNIGKLANKAFHITPDKTLGAAIGRMNNAGIRQLSVISPETRKFTGIITMTDIVRTEAESISEAQDSENTFAPDFSETKNKISRS